MLSKYDPTFNYNDYVYHVTPLSNIDSISKKGLLPMIGERSSICNESDERIYCFSSYKAMEEAVSGWFGELFEEDEKLIVYGIKKSEFNIEFVYLKNNDLFFECYIKEVISTRHLIIIDIL